MEDILQDALRDVFQNKNFTKDFKEFCANTFIIMKLCQAYEQGTEKNIKIENINDEKGAINFILDSLPLMNEISKNKILMNKKFIKEIITYVYIPLKIKDNELND